MDEERFWNIVDKKLQIDWGSPESSRIRRMVRVFRNLTSTNLLDFFRIYVSLHERAKKRELWGAALLLNGRSCGDECFDYFRNFLILAGGGTYQTAITTPDLLAEDPLFSVFAPGGFQERNLKGAIMAAYFDATGQNIFDHLSDYTDTRFLDDIDIRNWEAFSEFEIRRAYPSLCRIACHVITQGVGQNIPDPYEIAETRISGVGVIKIGDRVRFPLGAGKISKIRRFPGNLIRAHVLFKDMSREIGFDTVDGVVNLDS